MDHLKPGSETPLRDAIVADPAGNLLDRLRLGHGVTSCYYLCVARLAEAGRPALNLERLLNQLHRELQVWFSRHAATFPQLNPYLRAPHRRTLGPDDFARLRRLLGWRVDLPVHDILADCRCDPAPAVVEAALRDWAAQAAPTARAATLRGLQAVWRREEAALRRWSWGPDNGPLWVVRNMLHGVVYDKIGTVGKFFGLFFILLFGVSEAWGIKAGGTAAVVFGIGTLLILALLGAPAAIADQSLPMNPRYWRATFAGANATATGWLQFAGRWLGWIAVVLLGLFFLFRAPRFEEPPKRYEVEFYEQPRELWKQPRP